MPAAGGVGMRKYSFRRFFLWRAETRRRRRFDDETFTSSSSSMAIQTGGPILVNDCRIGGRFACRGRWSVIPRNPLP